MKGKKVSFEFFILLMHSRDQFEQEQTTFVKYSAP